MIKILSSVIETKSLKKLTLSKPADTAILKSTGRLIKIKEQTYIALETFYKNGKVTQNNIPATSAATEIAALIPNSYKQLNISTSNGDCEVKASKKDKITIINHLKNNCKEVPILTHNREKKYIIPSDEPVDFLIELGVQDSKGFIYDKKRSKFRQINRFLEIVADVSDKIISSKDLYILDLCCGKSYLSFALYHYFSIIRNCNVTMDCIDLKEDVIEFCASLAKKLNYSGLHFIAGDIRDFAIRRAPDLTVSLHACDIATDIVLAKGIDSGSRVILSTPCCHHEMMHQLKPQGVFTDFLLEHSILKQKLADAATDALRCKVLEIHGYDVTALELIDPEETPKNVLLRAIKRNVLDETHIERLRNEYHTICKTLGIHPFLFDKYVINDSDKNEQE